MPGKLKLHTTFEQPTIADGNWHRLTEYDIPAQVKMIEVTDKTNNFEMGLFTAQSKPDQYTAGTTYALPFTDDLGATYDITELALKCTTADDVRIEYVK
jgi:hypothetical protein